MRGFMRLLLMFGPMIFRQYEKYQRNKERQRYHQQNQPPMRQEQPRRRREMVPPPPPRKPQISEEERNFRLKEEDIMLDNETIQDYSQNPTTSRDMDLDRTQQPQSNRIEAPETENVVNEEDIVPSGKDKKEDDGFDLKDLFFEDEDDKEKDA